MSPPDTHWSMLAQQHLWYPYTQMLTAPAPLCISHADGVYLHTTDGRRIIDGISSWWVNIHGHNHPRLNRAITEQAAKMSQVIFAGLTHEPAARLAAALVEKAGGALPRVFLSGNGSTAVEVALKMAHQYWRNRGAPERTLFVGLTHAYHGDTFGTMAAGGMRTFHAAFAPYLFEVRRAHGATCPEQHDEAPCAATCLDSLARVLERDSGRIAAVILEPMLQGAGGMRIGSAAFLREARALTREHGVLLIADEVFTAFGRTGKYFACEHGPITPDIMCLSKALTAGYLPLGATLASAEVYASFLSEDRSRTFFHSHSFDGNALACAVACESMALFDDTRALDRVAALEQLFAARLAELARLPGVAKVRNIGALAVIELEDPGKAGYFATMGPRLYDALLRRGVLLRPLGNVLYFLPPYVITAEEAHAVFDWVAAVLTHHETL